MVTKFDNDIEEAILGAVIIEPEAIAIVAVMLKPVHFYTDANQKLYAVLLAMHNAGNAIDLLTVAEFCQRKKVLELVGGAAKIAQITSKVHSAANLLYHARILVELYLQRRLYILGDRIKVASELPDTEVTEIIDKSIMELVNMSSVGTQETRHIGTISEPLVNLIAKRQNQSKTTEAVEGMIYTGYASLDKLLGYFEPGDLVVIAARPSMGKTAFAQNLSKNIAQNQAIAFFSLEMSANQITNRFIIEESAIPSDQMKNYRINHLEMNTIFEAEERVRKLPIYIDDTAALTIPQLRAKLMILKARYNVKAFVFDYIQLAASGENHKMREAEISAISRGLKKVAKDLQMVAFALSQLNRAVETRAGNRRPMLADLRESGAIEQDADAVIFLHRPEKYGETEYADGTSTAGIAEIITAKHRNGQTGTIPLKFEGSIYRFSELTAKTEIFMQETTGFQSQFSFDMPNNADFWNNRTEHDNDSKF